MQNRIFSLYRAPFRTDNYGNYIWDSKGEMVADFREEGDTLQIRGWGRISYLEDADNLFDACEAFLLSLVPVEHRQNQEMVIQLFNKAWPKEFTGFLYFGITSCL